jgi:hypothetical protein
VEPFIIAYVTVQIIIIVLTALLKTDNRRKPVSQWTKDGKFIQNFNSITEASILTNTSSTGISNCCRGVQKTSGGYIWKYGNYKID